MRDVHVIEINFLQVFRDGTIVSVYVCVNMNSCMHTSDVCMTCNVS